MKKLTITLSEEIAAQVDQAAEQLGLSAEDFVRASVEEKLERLGVSFDEAAAYVVRKNAELYRRLA